MALPPPRPPPRGGVLPPSHGQGGSRHPPRTPAAEAAARAALRRQHSTPGRPVSGPYLPPQGTGMLRLTRPDEPQHWEGLPDAYAHFRRTEAGPSTGRQPPPLPGGGAGPAGSPPTWGAGTGIGPAGHTARSLGSFNHEFPNPGAYNPARDGMTTTPPTTLEQANIFGVSARRATDLGLIPRRRGGTEVFEREELDGPVLEPPYGFIGHRDVPGAQRPTVDPATWRRERITDRAMELVAAARPIQPDDPNPTRPNPEYRLQGLFNVGGDPGRSHRTEEYLRNRVGAAYDATVPMQGGFGGADFRGIGVTRIEDAEAQARTMLNLASRRTRSESTASSGSRNGSGRSSLDLSLGSGSPSPRRSLDRDRGEGTSRGPAASGSKYPPGPSYPPRPPPAV